MATKPAQMAVVTIRFVGEFLMPVNKALQLIDLMQHAVTCDPRFDGGPAMTYRVGEAPDVQMTTVKTSQIQFPPGTKPEPARAGKSTPRISREQLKLT